MLVAALALRLFRVLLAFITAASSLIALGLSAALVELFDAAGASRTSWAPRRAKVLPALAAALVEILAVALLELVRATRSAGLAKALFLALATAALIGIVAVALLELVDSAWRAEVLLLVLAAAALIV